MNVADHGGSGSLFETGAETRAENDRVVVKAIGDFRVGQWVIVSRCHVHYDHGFVGGPARPYVAENIRSWAGEIECRGFDGCRADWTTFVVHIESVRPLCFSWLVAEPEFQPNHRRWQWQGRQVVAGDDWIPLLDGVEIRFRKKDWQAGQVITFHARNRLVTRIRAIDGNAVMLDHAPNRTTADAVMRHCDQFALQDAVDRAIREKQSLTIPAGRYRLLTGLHVKDAAMEITGEGPDQTILDISDGVGAVFCLEGGKSVTVRQLGMVGHTGFNELPWYAFSTKAGERFWPTANQQMNCKGCAAANICATERVLFEDVTVRRMAAEAFYSRGPGRDGVVPGGRGPGSPIPYTKSITYHRCVVTDCASNAFNNNDFAENTDILYCRVERVHNLWEGANRFTRVIGNYVRHAHCGSYGNVSGRLDYLNDLGTGQTIIADNVFEGGEFGQGIGCQQSPSQIIIANNIFVNFSNATAIRIFGGGEHGRPARYATITGNIIDLTHVPGQLNFRRAGIEISASNVIVSNNQVYVRALTEDVVTGIQVSENATNVIVHDNIIERCTHGFRTGRVNVVVGGESGKPEQIIDLPRLEAVVKEVKGDRAFTESGLPKEWRHGHGYRNWRLHWLTGVQAGNVMTITEYDAATQVFTLTAPCVMMPGDRFAVFPKQANWSVHHNILAECACPMLLDGYGSDTSVFRENIVSRSVETPGNPAIVVAGNYQVADNQISGYTASEMVVRKPGLL